jgi:hypothetical protein
MLFEELDHLQLAGIGQEREKIGTYTTESQHLNKTDSVDDRQMEPIVGIIPIAPTTTNA